MKWIAILFLASSFAVACDRNVEPYDPNEKPEEPDLSKIFPETGGSPPGAQPPPADGRRGAPPVAAAEAPLRGTVRLADSVADRVPAGSILFIIARTGPGPPTAVKRVAAPSFPYAFEIGPDDRMIQAMPFQGPFELTARLDADGNATSRSPGDLAGQSAAKASPGDSSIEITIDQVL